MNAAHPSPLSSPASKLGGRVLVVDDDPQVRNALVRLFRNHEFELAVAATAEEALALAQGELLAAVVTDINMPGIGGLALLEKLSTLQPDARFVVVTAQGPIDRQLLPRTHSVQVFKKPWSAPALVDAVSGRQAPRGSSRPAPAAVFEPTRVLLIEAQQPEAAMLEAALNAASGGRHRVTHVDSLEAAKAALGEHEFDVMCLDLHLPDAEGAQAVIRLQAEAPHLGLVVLGDSNDEAVLQKAVQAGAHDGLVKGQALGPAIAKALKYAAEQKRAELRVAEMALCDQLTGLANRTLFRQRIAEAVNRARTTNQGFAVLLLDIDRFKSINDALGHDAGDAFLIRLSQRLKSRARASDTAARLGGDEFAILVDPIKEEREVRDVAERVLAELGKPLEIGGYSLEPTASIGAALFPHSGTDSDTLLSAADAAMYVIKTRGRNGVHIHGADLTRAMSERFEMESKLRDAVDARDFVLHYQPQVNERGDWVGAEALLRWAPNGGDLVPAYKFVPLLEETGLILELGAFIVDTACQQLKAWRAEGHHLGRVAVNLSAKQFVSHSLVRDIRNSVERAGLKPEDLELELTETALLHDTLEIKDILNELDRDGYSLALDDFGTGYCSLSYLQRFPIKTLKIDRSFVQDIPTDERRRALVGGIVHLAHRLGLEVVAEGVETEAQRQILSEENCAKMQGYLFGKPMAANAFIDGWRNARPGTLT